MTSFVLPWPDAALNPNARLHWARSAPKKRKYRAIARRVCAAWLGKARLKRDGIIHVEYVFFPPALKRKRDLDNLMASMKSATDGIADALAINDVNFRFSFGMGEGKGVAGAVGVTITAEK